MIKISTAQESDLPGINQVIEAAVNSWNLPERVKRLSLPSYHYNEMDLKHLEMIMAKQDDKIVAVASWEPADNKDTPGQQSGLLLHGLYVDPAAQNQGIATQLIDMAEHAAQAKGLRGILVKAQTDAVAFFGKRGFSPVAVTNPSNEYANRLWKPLNAK